MNPNDQQPQNQPEVNPQNENEAYPTSNTQAPVQPNVASPNLGSNQYSSTPQRPMSEFMPVNQAPRQPQRPQQSQQSQNLNTPQTQNASMALPGNEYVSNPFIVGMRSFSQAFLHNPVPVLLAPLVLLGVVFFVAILAGILSVAGGDLGRLLTMILLIVVYVIILPLYTALYFTIGAKSAQEESIPTAQALSQSMSKIIPMLGMMIVLGIITVIGLVLLIVPGLIIIARSALAPAVMINENLGIMASIKRSFALTKGHFFEMLAATMAGSVLGTYGLLTPYFSIGQIMGRYQDLKMLQETGAPKPKTHWLNFAVVLVLPVLITLLIIGGFLGFKDTQNKARNQSPFNSSQGLTPNSPYNPYSNPNGSGNGSSNGLNNYTSPNGTGSDNFNYGY